MNQKKCPKCGENNPAEAVMCWACYTPLSGGAGGGAVAPAPTGMAPKAGAKPGKDDAPAGDMKKAIPPWQIAVVVVGLLVLVGGGIKFAMGGSSESDDTNAPANPKEDKKAGTAPAPAPAPNPGGSSGGGGSAPSGPGTVPSVSDVPFIMIASPNPNYSIATMAIMPRQPPVNASKGAGIAAFARRQLLNVKRWDEVYIFVFNDSASAQTFRDYQAKRKQAPLTTEDYNKLSGIWSNTAARYWYRTYDGKESYVDPSQNTTFWTGNR